MLSIPHVYRDGGTRWRPDLAGDHRARRDARFSGRAGGQSVKLLDVFGLAAVTAMLVCYAYEQRSPWFILAFAVACWAASAYGFLQGAWPFGVVEAIWGVIAIRRWRDAKER